MNPDRDSNSEGDGWKGACGLLGDDYKLLTQYAKITQKGTTDDFIAVVAIHFGHTWRTAGERVKVLFKMGVIRKHGIYWVYDNKNPTIAGLGVMEQLTRDGTTEVPQSENDIPSENDIAFQKDIDQANREKYRAPQE